MLMVQFIWWWRNTC